MRIFSSDLIFSFPGGIPRRVWISRYQYQGNSLVLQNLLLLVDDADWLSLIG